MTRSNQTRSSSEGRPSGVPLSCGIIWGCLGGIAGTMLMDILLMAILTVFGQPTFWCFSIVGGTVARWMAMVSIQVGSGIPTGVVAHYIIGPLVGLLYGAAVTRFQPLSGGSLKKNLIVSFVYVEILSQPILASAAILLKMTTLLTWLWFVGSFFMHLIFSFVLGFLVWYGFRRNSTTRSTKLSSTL
jgi:hypothetical protein